MLIVLLSAFLLTNGGSKMNNNQNGELKWTNFTEGLKEASATNKKVLVDVYTDWCGWCKKMESDTYSDRQVQDYLNEKYVLVKLNAESSQKEIVDTTVVTDAQLASAFGVNGYPTTIFLTSSGQPITAAPGYMKPDEFLHVLKYIGGDYYKKMEFPEFLKSQGIPQSN
jgi:thioredoxin-related protein